ncbi:MAG: bifunctional phosphoribosylaminoimidazolecarboxamide formyltransferase/IMP cyclohydrolase [Pseudomonadota bacterium]
MPTLNKPLKCAPIKTAIISVSDKTGLIPFAQALHAHGVTMIASGGTQTHLEAAGIPVVSVSDITQFPELLDGRLKTLHPAIHGGILARRGQDEAVLAEHGIEMIDLVVVNLYPFEKTVSKSGVSRDAAIEQIDIGGPTLLRGAAKNHAYVTPVVDTHDYDLILSLLDTEGGIPLETRQRLAQKTFAHTAAYDQAIADYLRTDNSLTDRFVLSLHRAQTLKYGENPHQEAGYYRSPTEALPWVQRQGNLLSYNNLMDADAAYRCVRSFERPSCVIVKHANPCGVASANDCATAYDNAYRCDPVSAYGGVIAFNRPITAALMTNMIGRQFIEVIIAPRFEDDALALAASKPAIRLLQLNTPITPGIEVRPALGGWLVQKMDRPFQGQVDVVTTLQPTESQMLDLRFSFIVCQYLKSNAIVYAKDQCTLGLGGGQMSRVFSAQIAALKAEEQKHPLQNCVMASDAFIPFPDTLEVAAKYGIKAVIQPGGSKRDAEVIEAANRLGLIMVMTHERHFFH